MTIDSTVRLRCSTLVVALFGVSALTACAPGPEPQAFDGKVFKYDGSVQCGSPGTSVEHMALELTDRGIDVICGQKGSDGYAYCMACNCGSGSINVYTIQVENFADVESLGFAPVSALPEYQDQVCTP